MALANSPTPRLRKDGRVKVVFAFGYLQDCARSLSCDSQQGDTVIANVSISEGPSGGYVVRVDGGRPGLPYATLAQAIADHEDIPAEYATFVNLEYQGVRLATMAVDDMRGLSKTLAAELESLLQIVRAEA